MAISIETPETNDGPIDDNTAWSIYDGLAKASEQERPGMEAKLNVYWDAKDKIKKENENTHFEKVYTEPDYYNEITQSKVSLEATKLAPFPASAGVRAANRAFLASRLGVNPSDVGDTYEAQRDSYTQANFNKPTVNDQEFFTLVGGQFKKSKEEKSAVYDLHSRAVAQALEDSVSGVKRNMGATLQVWKEDYKGLISEKKDAQFYVGALRMLKQTENDIERLKQPAGRVWSSLTKFSEGQADDNDVLGMAAELSSLSRQDRKKIFGYAALAAESKKIDRGAFEQFAKNLGESISRSSDFFGKAQLSGEEAATRQTIQFLEFGRIEDLGEYAKNQLSSSEYAPALVGELSQEKKTEFANKLKVALPAFQIARELKALAREQIDPTVPLADEGTFLGTVERGTYSAAGSLPLMAVTALNPLLGLAAYAEEERDRILIENPDLDPGVAGGMALAEGAANAFIDTIQIGKFPVLAGLFKNARKNGWRGVRAIGETWAVQSGQELIQNAIAPVTETIVAALREDMKDKDVGQEIGRYLSQIPETLVATGWLSLIGGGALSIRDVKNPLDGLEDTLRMAGFSEEQRGKIKAATSPEQFDAIVQQEFDLRTPENIAAGEQESLAVAEKAKERQDSSFIPTLETRTKNGKTEYVIRNTDGTEAVWQDKDAADLAYVELRRNQLLNVNNGIGAAVDYINDYKKRIGRGENVQQLLTGQKQTSLLVEYEENPTPKTLNRLFETVRFFGDEITEVSQLANYFVKASNRGQLVNGIYESIIKVYEGSDGGFVIRDFSQDNLRRAIAEKFITIEEVRAELSKIAGTKNFENLKTETDIDVIESFSDVALAFMYGKVPLESLPPGLRTFLLQLAEFVKEILRRSHALTKLIAKGEVTQDFQQLLAASVGLDTDQIVRNESDRAKQKIERDTLSSLEQADLFSQADVNYSISRLQKTSANDLADQAGISRIIPNKYKDWKMLPIMADLLGIGSADGMSLEGGPGHPILFHGTGVAWRSNKGAVVGILTALKKRNAIYTDKDGTRKALVAVFAMSQDSHQSNRNTFLAYVKSIENANVSAQTKVQLAEYIRSKAKKNKKLKEFPLKWTTKTLDGYTSTLAFTDRSAIMKAMRQAGAKDIAVPDAETVVRQLLDDSYDKVSTGSMLNLMEVDISRLEEGLKNDTLKASDFGVPEHISYDTVLPGKLVAHLRNPVVMDVAFNDMVADMATVSPKSRPEYLMQAKLPKVVDIETLTAERIKEINLEQKGQTSIAQAKARIAALSDNWNVINKKSKKGIADFVAALGRNLLSETLTPITATEVRSLAKSGKMEVFNLNGFDVWFGLKARDEGGKELVSVISNEHSTGGMLDLVMMKAIQSGATHLDCYSVVNAKKPKGILPSIYSQHGWVEVKRSAYNKKYLGETASERNKKEAALKESWESQGWDSALQGMPDIVFMEYDRNTSIARELQPDAGRSMARRKAEGFRRKSDGPVDRNDVNSGPRSDSGESRGDAGGRRDTIPRKVRDFVSELKAASGNRLKAWGINESQRDEIVASAEAPDVNYSISRPQRLKMTRAEIIDAVLGSEDWKDFYDRHTELLVEYFGADSDLFQRILSATSQAASVKANVSMALRAYGQIKRGEGIVPWFVKGKRKMFLEGVVRNLERIIAEEKLQGRKISNYEGASAGDVSKVVVDRHVASMLFGTKTPSKAQFEKAERVLTEVANVLGWQPRQVQAAIWAASIRKNGLEPQSYDSYLKRLKSEGTLEQRIGSTVPRDRADSSQPGEGRLDSGSSVENVGGVTYSIGKAGDDRVSKALEARLQRNPAERLALYERAKVAFESVRAKRGMTSKGMITPEAALAQVEQERAATLADVEIDKNAEIEESGADILASFAERIESAKTDATKATFKREAQARASERKKGIEAKYKERADAINADFSTQAAQVADKAKAQNVISSRENKFSTLLQSLGELNAILSVLPAEIRGKVGGMMPLANLAGGTISSMKAEAVDTFLEKRIAMVDKVLERALKAEYGTALDKLLKRSKPTSKPGEKPKGKIGADIHAIFEVLREAKGWDDEETQAHHDKLMAGVDSGETSDDKGGKRPLTGDEIAQLMLEANLVLQIGDWKNKDASERATAVENATQVFLKGYNAFKLEKINDKERREKIADSLKVDTGSKFDLTDRQSRQTKDEGVDGSLRKGAWYLRSFADTIEGLFGRNSVEGGNMIDMVTDASFQVEDANQRDADEVNDLFKKLSKGNDYNAWELRYAMTEESVKAITPLGRELNFSQLEAVDIVLTWRRSKGEAHMIGKMDDKGAFVGEWHYDQAFVDSVEGQLTDAGRAWMDFVSAKYRDEWAITNPTFKELQGINLPQDAMYYPISAKPMVKKAAEMIDPSTGLAMAPNSGSPGFLKSINPTAIAEPEFKDSLQKYITHRRQLNHWLAFAPVMAELNPIIGMRNMSNHLEVRGGKEGAQTISEWMAYFVQGGYRDAGASKWYNQAIQEGLNRLSGAILIGRMSVLAVQSVQLGAAQAEMSASEYLPRIAKLLFSPDGWSMWKVAYDSQYIKRRVETMPPALRASHEQLMKAPPSRIRYWQSRVGETIAGADGVFSAGTYAIVYDQRKAKFEKEFPKASAEEIESMATSEAVRVTQRLVQPVIPAARSLMELQASTAMRSIWNFSSEPRQKVMLATLRMASKDYTAAEKARAFFVTWGIGGMLLSIVRSFMRDIRDDGEDEEFFDERNWSIKRLALESALGPVSGLPFVGDAIEGSVYAATGQYRSEGGMFAAIPKAVSSVVKIKDSEDVEDVLRHTENILMGASAFNSNAAAGASFAHVARDIFGITKNVIPKKETNEE